MSIFKGILLSLPLFLLYQDVIGQLVTYSTTNDSVRISLGIQEQNGEPFKVSVAEIVSSNKIIVSKHQERHGYIELYLPAEQYKKEHINYALRIYHLTDQSKNIDISLKETSICTGFCDPVIIRPNKPLIKPYESGNSKTFTEDEIEHSPLR